MKNTLAGFHIHRCWFLSSLLLCMFVVPQTLYGQVSSIQRITYGYPLIDSLPSNQFPRGGTYTAIIQGSGLVHVTGFTVPGLPAITGIVTSATDTAVAIQLSSTPVPENDTANAPIHVVDFVLLTTTGSIGAHISFDIVVGPPTQITSFAVSNSVKWIPAGVPTTVTYSVTALWAGNNQFWYIGCGECVGSFGTFTGNQFSVSFSFTTVVTITSTSDAPFSAFVGGVDGAGQGGVLGNAPLSPKYLQTPIPVVQMQLVDPVPTLLSGPAVTSDPTLLGNQGLGNVVNGVAADGVTQVVIRILGAPPNETFALNLAQDGGLAEIGSTSFQSNIPSLQVDSSGNAFVLYRAPLDFARPGGIDNLVPSRIVDLNFQSPDNPGVVGDTQITIVRPPVVLVHGNWSNSARDWQFFQFANPGAVPDLFTVDYSAVLAQGVVAASNYVLPQLRNVIQTYKSAAPTANGPVPVAAVQADLVAYSLGGLVSRALVTLQPFVNSSNYGSGYVHKLITLDTPHQGAELATTLTASNSVCHALFTAFVGPVQQNIQDMAPGSLLLRALASVRPGEHLPTSVIVSLASNQQQLEANIAYSPSIISDLCPNLLPPGGYQALFTSSTNPTGASDLIVSKYSQLATNLSLLGPTSVFPIPSMSFSSVIHDANPTLFPLGPDVRQINLVPGVFSLNYVGVPAPFPSTEHVFQLLNTPISQFGLIAP